MVMQPLISGTREVRFTFDDGPNPLTTPHLLDFLKEHGIKATFFMIGERLATEQGHQIATRVVAEGHQIGNHSYTHPDLTKLSAEQVQEEVSKTEKLISAVYKGPKILRPPYGAHNPAVDKIIQSLGYRLVFWNVDTLDWNQKFQPTSWIANGMHQIQAGHNLTVLNHDIHATTVSNFPEFFSEIQKLPDTKIIQLEA